MDSSSRSLDRPCLCERSHCPCAIAFNDFEQRLAEWLESPTGRVESYFARNPLADLAESHLALDLNGLQERRRYVIIDFERGREPRWHVDLGYVGERSAIERAELESRLGGRTRLFCADPYRGFSLVWDSLLVD